MEHERPIAERSGRVHRGLEITSDVEKVVGVHACPGLPGVDAEHAVAFGGQPRAEKPVGISVKAPTAAMHGDDEGSGIDRSIAGLP